MGGIPPHPILNFANKGELDVLILIAKCDVLFSSVRVQEVLEELKDKPCGVWRLVLWQTQGLGDKEKGIQTKSSRKLCARESEYCV